MASMPTRDITGKCEGECRDRVLEGQRERQNDLKSIKAQETGATPSVKWAKDRNEAPGFLGGHV